MAQEALTKRTASVKLENGTDSSGNIKYVSAALGTLSPQRWDADKILGIVSALAPCLNKTIGRVEGTTTFDITAS